MNRQQLCAIRPFSATAFRFAALLTVSLAMLAPAGNAAELSITEIEQAKSQLARTRNALLVATTGLSAAQWNFKPAPETWSIAEVLEHIAVTEGSLYDLVTKQVMQAPAGKAGRDTSAVDKAVLALVSDRTQKAQAPQDVRPSGRWNPEECLERFEDARARTVKLIDTGRGLRDHVIDSPLGQPLDAYQWILLISAHSDRHTKQILEVKAHPGFPAQ